MPPLRKKRPPKRAPSVVYFRHAKNEKGHKQLCVYVECELSGNLVGPVWGHSAQSVNKALAMLTQECDCPSKFHAANEYHGKRILHSARREE